MAIGRRRRKPRAIETVEGQVDLMPLMSMFISIIPMLLLSAVFIELGAIKMQLPSGDPNAPLDGRREATARSHHLHSRRSLRRRGA